MTTTVKIEHKGPGHHNVKVARTYDSAAHASSNTTTVLKVGQAVELSVYDGVHIGVTETADAPSNDESPQT